MLGESKTSTAPYADWHISLLPHSAHRTDAFHTLKSALVSIHGCFEVLCTAGTGAAVATWELHSTAYRCWTAVSAVLKPGLFLTVQFCLEHVSHLALSWNISFSATVFGDVDLLLLQTQLLTRFAVLNLPGGWGDTSFHVSVFSDVDLLLLRTQLPTRFATFKPSFSSGLRRHEFSCNWVQT